MRGDKLPTPQKIRGKSRTLERGRRPANPIWGCRTYYNVIDCILNRRNWSQATFNPFKISDRSDSDTDY